MSCLSRSQFWIVQLPKSECLVPSFQCVCLTLESAFTTAQSHCPRRSVTAVADLQNLLKTHAEIPGSGPDPGQELS